MHHGPLVLEDADGAREQLREALAEIQTALAESDERGTEPELHRSLRERLAEAARHFEGERPTLTDALSALSI